MDQNVVTLNEVDLEKRLLFSRSVLPILVYRRESGEPDGSKPVAVTSGIVTVSGSDFCHIIANKTLLFPKDASKFRYEIVFPDKTTGDLENTVMEQQHMLAAFYFPVSTGTVDAVQFSNQTVVKNQKLKMFGYDLLSKTGQLLNHLVDGSATHLGDEYIAHNCTPSASSRLGSPIFDEEGALVGISYHHVGVTYAMNMEIIADSLSRFYEGMNKKPISVILQHIKAVGEAKFMKI